jgi:hypothetical protein
VAEHHLRESIDVAVETAKGVQAFLRDPHFNDAAVLTAATLGWGPAPTSPTDESPRRCRAPQENDADTISEVLERV